VRDSAPQSTGDDISLGVGLSLKERLMGHALRKDQSILSLCENQRPAGTTRECHPIGEYQAGMSFATALVLAVCKFRLNISVIHYDTHDLGTD
jgi:hypothetical protein